MSRLFVGNLAFSVSDNDLMQLFSEVGTVVSARIAKDKFSGESKGFAFVEYENKEMAQAAIQTLNGRDLGGRAIRVDEAKPPTNSGGSFRSGGGAGRSGGGYSGGGDRNRSGGDRSSGGSRGGSSRSGGGFSGDRDGRRSGPSWR
jgi:RNA recognition motif-containing protein